MKTNITNKNNIIPYFRHRSPYYYLAWAGLYLVLGILALAGVSIPKFFGKNLAAGDNLTLPFPTGEGLFFAPSLAGKGTGG